ncbi:MAG: hypothetical protein Udaeo2_20560 [Candidatus Udaeobacter sp.]|nr:MAG: hypothetical protein Udaeo2_20560 [Candidatus Udaeobacter sp.]
MSVVVIDNGETTVVDRLQKTDQLAMAPEFGGVADGGKSAPRSIAMSQSRTYVVPALGNGKNNPG